MPRSWDGASAAGQMLVAFAAETNDVIDNARGKLARKNADLVVANDVTRSDAGFGVDTNRHACFADSACDHFP